MLDRGEITGWCNINKFHAAGMELITLIIKKLCTRLSCSSSNENKSQLLQKPWSVISLPVNRFLTNTEELVVPDNMICNFVY